MVKIRLSRFGRKKRPFYRIVVTDVRKKANGAYLDNVGTYDPISGVSNINDALVLSYLEKGAQVSDVVKSLLSKKGLWKTFKQSCSK